MDLLKKLLEQQTIQFVHCDGDGTFITLTNGTIITILGTVVTQPR